MKMLRMYCFRFFFRREFDAIVLLNAELIEQRLVLGRLVDQAVDGQPVCGEIYVLLRSDLVTDMIATVCGPESPIAIRHRAHIRRVRETTERATKSRTAN